MKATSATRILVFVFWSVALLFAAGCAQDPSEAALVQTMEDMEEAGQNRDVGSFMEHVADDFVGNGGEFDRRGLERLLLAVTLRQQSIGVTRAAMEIEVREGRAVVQMQLLVTAGSGGLLPENGQWFTTESRWRFVDGAWQLASADWRSK